MVGIRSNDHSGICRYHYQTKCCKPCCLSLIYVEKYMQGPSTYIFSTCIRDESIIFLADVTLSTPDQETKDEEESTAIYYNTIDRKPECHSRTALEYDVINERDMTMPCGPNCSMTRVSSFTEGGRDETQSISYSMRNRSQEMLARSVYKYDVIAEIGQTSDKMSSTVNSVLEKPNKFEGIDPADTSTYESGDIDSDRTVVTRESKDGELLHSCYMPLDEACVVRLVTGDYTEMDQIQSPVPSSTTSYIPALVHWDDTF